jgi:5-methylthioribose kinase
MVDDSVDLTVVTGVRRYLADTEFASDTITVLSGDFSNFTYRVHLNDSFKGKETFILKYALPYFAASGGAIHLATERQVGWGRIIR